ncbi:MAG: flagellin [Pelagimonas sp.]|jgi:flagellin|nr:flagellin [Pelagimonas sp.]
MSSILTNNGAMVALQTLKSINSNLAKTQSEISTGKTVATAKDNSAVWAISKVMEADVKGFKGISDSLNLGSSTVAVARQAAETVTDLLTDIKGKIVSAQEENVDRDKIQADIDALRDQIGAVVSAAQFNGLNLLQNTDKTDGSGTVNILSSLDRSGTGVAASDITVRKQDLGTQAEAAGTVSVDAGVAIASLADGATGTALTYANDTDGSIAGGNTYQAVGSHFGLSANVSYVAADGDTQSDVVSAMVSRLNDQAEEDGVDITFAAGSAAGSIDVTNNTGSAITTIVAATGRQASLAGTENDGTIGGGLEDLSGIDVKTVAGADQALIDIENLIQTAIDSAAAFGSAQGRIDTQADFVSGLTDALKSGIGTLVDADMEEASARLQALQVQQQLGVQALSIANQAPQSLLSLFQ